MSNTPDDIARRANETIKAPGFCGCTVVSKSPEIYAYTFDSGIEAESWKGSMEMITPFAYIIKNDAPNVVIERR
jgi:hypothetical protein